MNLRFISMQIFLWEHIGESAFECDETNKLLSKIVVFVVTAVPFTLSVFSYTSPLQHLDPVIASRLSTMRGRVVRDCMLFYGIFICYYLYGLAKEWYPLCTYVGPWGHQAWPLANAPHLFWRVFFVTIYLFLCGSAIIFHTSVQVEGMFAKMCACLVGGSSTMVLFIVLGPEFGSVWCWSASLVLFASVLDPYTYFLFESDAWYRLRVPPFLKAEAYAIPPEKKLPTHRPEQTL